MSFLPAVQQPANGSSTARPSQLASNNSSSYFIFNTDSTYIFDLQYQFVQVDAKGLLSGAQGTNGFTINKNFGYAFTTWSNIVNAVLVDYRTACPEEADAIFQAFPATLTAISPPMIMAAVDGAGNCTWATKFQTVASITQRIPFPSANRVLGNSPVNSFVLYNSSSTAQTVTGDVSAITALASNGSYEIMYFYPNSQALITRIITQAQIDNGNLNGNPNGNEFASLSAGVFSSASNGGIVDLGTIFILIIFPLVIIAIAVHRYKWVFEDAGLAPWNPYNWYLVVTGKYKNLPEYIERRRQAIALRQQRQAQQHAHERPKKVITPECLEEMYPAFDIVSARQAADSSPVGMVAPGGVSRGPIRNQECNICLDEFPRTEDEQARMPTRDAPSAQLDLPQRGPRIVRQLNCGHAFHVDCVDMWLTTNSSLCPTCKTDCDPLTPAPEGQVPEASGEPVEDGSPSNPQVVIDMHHPSPPTASIPSAPTTEPTISLPERAHTEPYRSPGNASSEPTASKNESVTEAPIPPPYGEDVQGSELRSSIKDASP
ncbi:hypothetical protein BZG36_04547 [Bifiguratus adelaidae]|uniref:RING-type domain-containing protein n=1 Tax=Bifiguratus adelaidae TaxID=1938954 RepID=A0A261XV60_9FUNG|nr:hypothetical protein BZG36_04547 [Bifiguratus adelaidae]